jgi:hypothetical protein
MSEPDPRVVRFLINLLAMCLFSIIVFGLAYIVDGYVQ